MKASEANYQPQPPDDRFVRPPGFTQVPVTGLLDKVRNSAISGAAITVLIAIARQTGYKLDPELAAAIVLLVSTAAGYLTKLKWREISDAPRS